MSDISNRIDYLLTLNHKRVADIVRGTGIKDSTIRGWREGKIPSCDSIIKVADFLGVSVRWLITGEDVDSENAILTPEEKELIENFRHLNPADRNAVLTLASSLESQYCAKANIRDISG